MSQTSLGRATIAVITAAFVLFPTLSYAGTTDSAFYASDEDTINYCPGGLSYNNYIYAGTLFNSNPNPDIPIYEIGGGEECVDVALSNFINASTTLPAVFTVIELAQGSGNTSCDDLNSSACIFANQSGDTGTEKIIITSFAVTDSNPFVLSNFSEPDDFPLTNGVGIAMLSISPLSLILVGRKRTRTKIITRFGKVVNYVSSKYDKAIDAMFKRRTY